MQTGARRAVESPCESHVRRACSTSMRQRRQPPPLRRRQHTESTCPGCFCSTDWPRRDTQRHSYRTPTQAENHEPPCLGLELGLQLLLYSSFFRALATLLWLKPAATLLVVSSFRANICQTHGDSWMVWPPFLCSASPSPLPVFSVFFIVIGACMVCPTPNAVVSCMQRSTIDDRQQGTYVADLPPRQRCALSCSGAKRK